MNQKSPDFEYEYIQSLCEAIESFTKEAERINISVFSYRGANLKYAFERFLYFSFLNNERLINIFKQWKLRQLPEKIELNSETERDIAVILCGGELQPNSVSIQQKGKAKELIKSLIRNISHLIFADKIIGFFIDLTNFFIFYKTKKTKVIFTLVHEKFLNYLKPITDKLESEYQYLSIYPRVDKILLAKNLLSIKAPVLGYRLKSFLRYRKYLSDAQLTQQYDIIYDALEKLKPKTVIVIEGNAANNEIANQACKQLGINAVCIQQGWSPIIHTGFRNMSYSKMLVWGDGFAKLLAPYNPLQKFVAVGSHILSPPAETKKIQTKGQKTISFFLSAPSGLLTQEIWDDYFDFMVWTAKEFPKKKIIVSDDPVSPLNGDKKNILLDFKNLSIISPLEQKLKETLESSDITVLIMSTIVLESIAADVPPLVLNITSLPDYFPNVDADGAGIEVKDNVEAKKILKKAMIDENFLESFKPAMKDFRKKFFADWGEDAVKKILREIIQ